MTFTEIADRVWIARLEWFDATVSVIGGERGLAVVDTHASEAAGRHLVSALAPLGRVHAVVNTHWHFDHTFGNAALRTAWPQAEIHAHEQAVLELREGAPAIKARYAESDDPHRAEIEATEVVLPTRTFSSVRLLDLGDRQAELLHPGRGHTGGDLIVNLPDAQVLLAGDLVEESGPPSYGEDSWPLEWPLSLDMVLSLSTSSTTIVPGHGRPVDRDFVEQQRADIGTVAETVRDLAGRGVPASLALDQASWPFPKEGLRTAVRRAYEQLPRAQKRLPLI